jgi:hypothetical protein
MMYHALKRAVACLPAVLFGLGAEGKASTLLVADNELGGPIVGELDTNSVLPVVIFTHAFSVPGPINGISLGPNGQVFVATDGGIYDYTRDGALLHQFLRIVGFGSFGDLAFDGLGPGATVPEPSTAFLFVIGLFAVAASSRSLRCSFLPSRATDRARRIKRANSRRPFGSWGAVLKSGTHFGDQ